MKRLYKRPLKTYEPRLKRFLLNMHRVKEMKPYGHHLWVIMDLPAFEDTETAFEAKLVRQRRAQAARSTSKPKKKRSVS